MNGFEFNGIQNMREDMETSEKLFHGFHIGFYYSHALHTQPSSNPLIQSSMGWK